MPTTTRGGARSARCRAAREAALTHARKDGADADQLERRAYELAVLDAIRKELLGMSPSVEPVLWGPSRIVSEIVDGAVRDAAAALSSRLEAQPRADAAEREELLRAAAVVTAWIRSYIDVQAVQWFSFDVNFDQLTP